jgi:cytochrome c553
LKITILLGTLVLISLGAASLRVSEAGSPAALLQYTNGDELVRPEGYREWVFLSSGLRLSSNTSPVEGATFTNVFVDPSAYHQFLATGSWPDKTVLVEEKRTASNKGSLDKASQFQTDLTGLAVQVKDAARFPDSWGYFSFDSSQKTAKANAKARCGQCHHDGGAVDSTYVQFYPTLKPVAQLFGTLHEAGTGTEAY